MRYEVVFGFNTKQWWVYDNDTDEYCDPPSVVLDEVKSHSADIDEQERFFKEIVSAEPSWLNDNDYRYTDIEI